MSDFEESLKQQAKAAKSIRRAMESLDDHARAAVAAWVAETYGAKAQQHGGKS